MAKKFVSTNFDEPSVFFVYGNSFDIDLKYLSWQDLEEFFMLIARKDDIFYGTNSEVFLGE